MYRFTTLACNLIVLALLAIPAWAQNPAANKKEEFGAGGFGAGGFDRKEAPPPTLLDVIDADGDGAISDLEARAAVSRLQALPRSKDPQAKELVSLVDKDGDGKVSQQEALMAVAKVRLRNDEMGKRVDEIFQRLDEDRDEAVSRDEFHRLREELRNLDQFGSFVRLSVERLFETLDVDKDNKISVVEAQFMADQFGRMSDWRRRDAAADARLRQQVAASFANMDKNKDQRISKREADGEVEEKFDAIDADGNGKLTVNELFNYARQNQPPRDDNRGRSFRRP